MGHSASLQALGGSLCEAWRAVDSIPERHRPPRPVCRPASGRWCALGRTVLLPRYMCVQLSVTGVRKKKVRPCRALFRRFSRVFTFLFLPFPFPRLLFLLLLRTGAIRSTMHTFRTPLREVSVALPGELSAERGRLHEGSFAILAPLPPPCLVLVKLSRVRIPHFVPMLEDGSLHHGVLGLPLVPVVFSQLVPPRLAPARLTHDPFIGMPLHHPREGLHEAGLCVEGCQRLRHRLLCVLHLRI
mmetsp:Transcript_110270/g.321144  ORF Transcript_110270/g.321144 Transcript_110270/m.321144 type:complete len:243 (-) Transcript_110270:668-1396(-)